MDQGCEIILEIATKEIDGETAASAIPKKSESL
jgi:hypothetical protein